MDFVILDHFLAYQLPPIYKAEMSLGQMSFENLNVSGSRFGDFSVSADWLVISLGQDTSQLVRVFIPKQ